MTKEQGRGQRFINSANGDQTSPNCKCLELDREYDRSLLRKAGWNTVGKLLWGFRISSALREKVNGDKEFNR